MKRTALALMTMLACLAGHSAPLMANVYNVPDSVLELTVAEYATLGILQRRDLMADLVDAEKIKYDDLNACLIQYGYRADAQSLSMNEALFACIRYARGRIGIAG